MSDRRAMKVTVHCDSCGQPVPTILGVALIQGCILVAGDLRVQLGPLQAAIVRELSIAGAPLSKEDLADRIYQDEDRDDRTHSIQNAIWRLSHDTLPPFGLTIAKVTQSDAPFRALHFLSKGNPEDESHCEARKATA